MIKLHSKGRRQDHGYRQLSSHATSISTAGATPSPPSQTGTYAVRTDEGQPPAVFSSSPLHRSPSSRSPARIPRGGSSRTPLLLRSRRKRNRCPEWACGWMLEGWPDEQNTTRAQVLVLGVVLLLASAGEQVLRKVIATNLYNYRWFLVQLLSLVTFVMTMAPSLAQRRKIQQSMRTFSFRRFAWIGLLDAFHSMLLLLPMAIVPGTLSVAIPQLLFPVTVVVMWLCGALPKASWSSTYWRLFVLGSVVAIAGAVLAILPLLTKFPACADEHGGIAKSELVSNLIMLFVSLVPAALSTTYKKTFLTHHRMDPLFVGAMSALCQFVVGFVFSPLFIRLQYKLADTTLDLVHVFSNFGDGFKCIAGVNSTHHDACKTKAPYLALELLGYLCCLGTMQIVTGLLLRKTNNDGVVSLALLASSVASLAIFFVPATDKLLVSDFQFCGSTRGALMVVGTFLVVAGSLVSHTQQAPSHREVDVWECIEKDQDPELTRP